MKRQLKVAQLGLGPIGLECLRLAATQPWAKIIGGIDIDPGKIGHDLGEASGSKVLRGLRVVSSLQELSQKPDLVFHTAVSKFQVAYGQLEPLVCAGISVVSSCEELIFPQLRQPALAAKLDRLCQKTGARVVGAGVNPGFVMDLLPVCLSAVTAHIRGIHIRRVVDAATRRQPLQKKIGSGLEPEEFQGRLVAGTAGHAGLSESTALLVHSLGLKSGRIQETGEAVVANKNLRTRYVQVRKGQTCGLRQRAATKATGGIPITLELEMYLGAAHPRDEIRIEGDPTVELIVRGGVAGDQATVAALVNAAPRLLLSAPGLRLVTELPTAAGSVFGE